MLRELGKLAFLQWHSPLETTRRAHSLLSIETLEIPISLGFYYTAYSNDNLVGFGTYAFVSPDQIPKVLGKNREPMRHEDFHSGDDFWIVDIVAPFSKNSALNVINVFRRDLPPAIKRMRAIRGSRAGNVRVLEYFRTGAETWAPKYRTIESILTEAKMETSNLQTHP
ncbi:MAG: hypothetical protein COA47_06105 [Robiginitomaculum sp.]|nr:MAG: hypothetical protein COA47_06105 [Robiginitomaculum sp.]